MGLQRAGNLWKRRRRVHPLSNPSPTGYPDMPAPTTLSLPMPIGRRAFLRQTGGGFGSVALAALLAGDSPSALGANTSPVFLTHAPKARRVIQLFMNGGVSQMD